MGFSFSNILDWCMSPGANITDPITIASERLSKGRLYRYRSFILKKTKLGIRATRGNWQTQVFDVSDQYSLTDETFSLSLSFTSGKSRYRSNPPFSVFPVNRLYSMNALWQLHHYWRVPFSPAEIWITTLLRNRRKKNSWTKWRWKHHFRDGRKGRIRWTSLDEKHVRLASSTKIQF